MDKVRRILLIGVARIGDTLLLTPAMRAVATRYPRAELTVLAHPGRREVLENLPFIHRLGGITKRRAPFLGRLPGRSHDLAFVWGKDIELVRYALRVSRTVYVFDEKEFSCLASHRLNRVAHPPPGHAVRDRLALVEAAGVVASDLRLAYVVQPGEQAAARARLQAAGATGRPLIGLQAFSFPTKAHRDWPLDHFAGLIRRIATAHPNAAFVVLGDVLAARLAQPLADQFPDRLRILAGQTSLRESAALMSCLDLYVGVDTGPTHIAGALDKPMVALYHYRYPGANLAPLQNPRCAICEHPDTGSNLAEGAVGMEAITVELVAALALEQLAAAR